jgi:hypothetical protein
MAASSCNNEIIALKLQIFFLFLLQRFMDPLNKILSFLLLNLLM